LAASSQILRTNETGSTGALVLKKITEMKVRRVIVYETKLLTTLYIQLDRPEQRFGLRLADVGELLLDFSFDVDLTVVLVTRTSFRSQFVSVKQLSILGFDISIILHRCNHYVPR
jgi:hypothetical protein